MRMSVVDAARAARGALRQCIARRGAAVLLRVGASEEGSVSGHAKGDEGDKAKRTQR